MGLGSTPSRGSQSDELPGEFVVINVTRGAPGVADLAPFKIVMKVSLGLGEVSLGGGRGEPGREV